jgi:hypothetical protein
LGDHERVNQLVAEEDWEELKKYPVYGRCPFSSEPFCTIPMCRWC